MTSTYDHRIIQGAQSGEFLKRISELLLGKNNFYEDIFASLEVPYKPYVWLAKVSGAAPCHSVGKSRAPTPMMAPWPSIKRGTEC